MTPYEKHRNGPLWKVIEQAIDDLKENRDLEFRTSKDHIVGYLTQVVADFVENNTDLQEKE